MKEQCVPSQNIGSKNVENNICAQMVGNVCSTNGKRSPFIYFSQKAEASRHNFVMIIDIFLPNKN